MNLTRQNQGMHLSLPYSLNFVTVSSSNSYLSKKNLLQICSKKSEIYDTLTYVITSEHIYYTILKYKSLTMLNDNIRIFCINEEALLKLTVLPT